jgi:hypothetical protein
MSNPPYKRYEFFGAEGQAQHDSESGIGLTERLYKRMFKPFFRANSDMYTEDMGGLDNITASGCLIITLAGFSTAGLAGLVYLIASNFL